MTLRSFQPAWGLFECASYLLRRKTPLQHQIEFMLAARKCEQSLLDVPISKIGRQGIEDLNLRDMLDVATMSRGLFMHRTTAQIA